jgi:outer membrane protein TolC
MKHSLLFICLLPLLSTAQLDHLTLDGAIAAALKSNYNVLMAKKDAASFTLDYEYADAAFLPRLNATAAKTWNVNAQKQELANGSKRDTSGLRSNNLNAAISLNWTLFDGMKMFATRERLQQLDQLGLLNVKAQMIATIATVNNVYYSIVKQKQQLKAIEEQMSINEERVKLADRKLSVGLGSKPELLQAKVDLNAQKSSRLNQLSLIDELKAQLNQLMGVETNKRYEVDELIPLVTGIEFGKIYNDIVNTNVSLMQARQSIGIAQTVIKERKAEKYPVLSFNSGYTFGRLQNQAVINNFTPLFNQNKSFNYGIGLSIPILNGFNTKRQIKQAQIDLEFQELNYKNQLSLVDLNLTNAFKQYELERNTLTLEEENIELARENVTIALERFKQGVSTYLELREAQKSLENAYNRLIASRYNTKLAEIELMRLKGDLLK